MSGFDYSSEAGNAYHLAHHGEFINNPNLLEAWGSYAHRTYLGFLRPGQSVLEFGAGLGANLVSVKKCCSVYAVEQAPLAQKHCAFLGLSVFDSFAKVNAALRFDAIMLRHVLEHLSEPRALLSEFLGRLSPGGRLVLVLPMESPRATVDKNDCDHHLYSWNRQTITNLLEHAGYRVLSARINYYNGKKIFLPLYRLFGSRVYVAAMSVLGRLRNRCEIVIEACAEAS
ncbi:MAG: class I SAM-dependent methyltransferase [Candidatus Omnitrophota bacterium]|jgi:SAM-dependent methyltransferase